LHERAYQDFPRVTIYAMDLAGTYTNRGDVARAEKQVEEALAWYGRAADILERANALEPRNVTACYGLFNLLWSRAKALGDLGRKEDAARDWKRAVEVSEGQSHILMRLYRPPALARLGEHARAAAEADALVAEGKTEGTNLYNFAYTHALGVTAARQDARLAPAEQARLAERYGARAVELLTIARAAGFFRQSGKLEHLKTDKDMDAVRSRPDFQQLLAELDAQSGPKGK
jgi:tetratricopeptide (TPR) repeat protein